jgi:hypothetical protein
MPILYGDAWGCKEHCNRTRVWRYIFWMTVDNFRWDFFLKCKLFYFVKSLRGPYAEFIGDMGFLLPYAVARECVFVRYSDIFHLDIGTFELHVCMVFKDILMS